MREQGNQNHTSVESIMTAVGMILAGIGFLVVGGIEGLAQTSAGLLAGVVPMIFGAGFIGVAGMYLIGTAGECI